MSLQKETTRLLSLRDRATKGPWKRRNGTGEFDCFVEGPKKKGKAYAAEILGDDYTMFGDDEQRANDVDFVASAHDMADHIERLQDEIDNLNTRPDSNGEAETDYIESVCYEKDGCPTELAVLQRFWRENSKPYKWGSAVDALCNYGEGACDSSFIAGFNAARERKEG